jgi:hypothetical protein
MQDFEKLGVFYLGRHYDLATRQSRAEPLLYDAKDLTTHGLVVGMTGSGKTGLCVGLIEEAALDGIPAIVIDPKGDLGNLMLRFPELRPSDFEPWINPDDAQRQGVAVAEYAADQAQRWTKGLAAWGQDGERIRRLRAAADVVIYTPGSSAGLPVSILRSFAVPPPEVMEDAELLRDRVGSTVSGLMGLAGISADPDKSREGILLAQLLQQAWAQGRDLDLAGLIQAVQQPPVARIGVFDLETFFPAKERFELAMQLNALLASPSFAAWMEGEALDPATLLYDPAGKPRVAVFSIAHLGDAERMFFVSLLLNVVLGWMRTLSGTNSLRALLYMDEIFGYFPPVANPPSKRPLLTLLKQARAYGLGVVLATQNPVDLDYKGLANIGTWFIGRLQTDRDKARVLEGLEGAAAGQGAPFDRARAEQTLAGLGSRVFLLHNVHEDAPQVFESRWAMSYLRGPLSRSQVKALMDGWRAATRVAPASATATAPVPMVAAPAVTAAPAGVRDAALGARPALPPDVPQFFAPARGLPGPGASVVYVPELVGAATVRYTDAKLKIDVTRELVARTPIGDGAIAVDWRGASEVALDLAALRAAPEVEEATYDVCPPAASRARSYAGWEKDFAAWIRDEHPLSLWRSAELGLVSEPGEDERAFRIRLQQTGRERRDEQAATLRRKYEPKVAALQERLRRAHAARSREEEQAKRAKMNTAISFGTTLLGAFLGRRAFSATTVGKAATTMRSAGRAADQAGDVTRAKETVEAVQQQLEALEAEFAAEARRLATEAVADALALDTLSLRPSRGGVQVRLVALVWLPHRRDATGATTPLYV